MIPKEKLTAYQRWELQDFRGEQSPSKPSPQTSKPAANPAQAIKLPTAEDIERIHAQAHKDGYAAGYEEGTARVRMEAMHLDALIENLSTALGTLDQQIAEELLALAVEVARKVVSQTLAIKPDVILATVREALQQLPQPDAVIFLHPEDAALVSHAMGEQLDHTGHRIFDDATLTRGSCRIEVGGSQIDATIETRWRRVVEGLGLKGEWALAS